MHKSRAYPGGHVTSWVFLHAAGEDHLKTGIFPVPVHTHVTRRWDDHLKTGVYPVHTHAAVT